MRYSKQSGNPKAVRMDPEDEQLLVACAAAEKLSMSDTIRRAIRAYAKTLGVAPQQDKVA